MDVENIKMRIRDRLFNRNLLTPSPEFPDSKEAGPSCPEFPSKSDAPKLAADGRISRHRIKRKFEKVPVLGRLLLWTWRIINLPLWFRQLRDHFLNVASDVDSLKSSVSRSSALTRSFQASLDAQSRAAEETKASLDHFSTEIRRVESSFRDTAARLEALLSRHEDTLTQLGQTAQEHDGTLRVVQASLDDLYGGLGKVREFMESFAAAIRNVEDHGGALDRLDALLEIQSASLEKVETSLSVHSEALNRLDASIGGQGEAVRELRDIVSRAEGPVGVENVLVTEMPRYVDRKTASGDEDGFYLGFENFFRGTEAEISGRQERYLGYAAEARSNVSNTSAHFLDVGCGRGEFLKLLKGASIAGKGVETNRLEYEKLRAEGLDVTLSDANAYLGKLRNGSLSGISAFQVVEHFSLEYLKKFLALAYRKTARNGVIILETVNPKCGVALRNFFLDLTHVRPYPPELLKFLLEWHGYGNVAMVFSAPCAPPFRVKDFPEYNYMDYAAVGWKR